MQHRDHRTSARGRSGTKEVRVPTGRDACVAIEMMVSLQDSMLGLVQRARLLVLLQVALWEGSLKRAAHDSHHKRGAHASHGATLQTGIPINRSPNLEHCSEVVHVEFSSLQVQSVVVSLSGVENGQVPTRYGQKLCCLPTNVSIENENFERTGIFLQANPFSSRPLGKKKNKYHVVAIVP